MGYKLKLNPISSIKKRLELDNNGDVQAFFTSTCQKEMDPFVPKDQGDLRKQIKLRTDSITYESEYAKYQYKGMREDGSHVVRNYSTPGTGPYWDKRMWSVQKDKILRQVENYIKRGGK